MECLRCSSKRIAQVSGLVAAGCDWSSPAGERKGGAVPLSVGINSWDPNYLCFQYCLDCGQLQGQFPIPRKAELRAFKEKAKTR